MYLQIHQLECSCLPLCLHGPNLFCDLLRALGLSASLLALLPAGPANAEDDEDDDEEEEERKKILPRPVSLGLKAIVVAGTLYALAELYTAPKIETETRRGEEATGERVLLCLCPCLSCPVCVSFSRFRSRSLS